jgi:hypothetical protein
MGFESQSLIRRNNGRALLRALPLAPAFAIQAEIFACNPLERPRRLNAYNFASVP